MKMTLIRDVKAPEFTLGKLQCGKYELFTCEDAIREVKIPGRTCVPTGTYKVIMNFSNRFQRIMPLLINVPNFEGVRIHSGNTSADTEGCVLVGTARTKEGVSNSRFASTTVNETIENALQLGQEITLEII